jgi:glutaredoxin-like YruB-family protein
MNDKKVKVYSTPVCPFCITLKDFLKKRGIDFEDINVVEDEEARNRMIENTGQSGVPVFEADGEFVVGFKKDKICKILNIEEQND